MVLERFWVGKKKALKCWYYEKLLTKQLLKKENAQKLTMFIKKKKHKMIKV